jgi:hypothetical protein
MSCFKETEAKYNVILHWLSGLVRRWCVPCWMPTPGSAVERRRACSHHSCRSVHNLRWHLQSRMAVESRNLPGGIWRNWESHWRSRTEDVNSVYSLIFFKDHSQYSCRQYSTWGDIAHCQVSHATSQVGLAEMRITRGRTEDVTYVYSLIFLKDHSRHSCRSVSNLRWHLLLRMAVYCPVSHATSQVG